MSKIRDWLILNFLPAWAKESVYKENQKLKEKIKLLEQDNKVLKAYVSGLEYGIRKKVVIQAGEK